MSIVCVFFLMLSQLVRWCHGAKTSLQDGNQSIVSLTAHRNAPKKIAGERPERQRLVLGENVFSQPMSSLCLFLFIIVSIFLSWIIFIHLICFYFFSPVWPVCIFSNICCISNVLISGSSPTKKSQSFPAICFTDAVANSDQKQDKKWWLMASLLGFPDAYV